MKDTGLGDWIRGSVSDSRSGDFAVGVLLLVEVVVGAMSMAQTFN